MSGSLLPFDATLSSEQARQLYLDGVACFNAGRYFEVHELLEPLYLRTTGSMRRFLQGLIQAAAAFFHIERGRTKPGLILLRAAIGRLEAEDGIMLGLRTETVVVQLKGALAVVAEVGEAQLTVPCWVLEPDAVISFAQPLSLSERHVRLLDRRA